MAQASGSRSSRWRRRTPRRSASARSPSPCSSSQSAYTRRAASSSGSSITARNRASRVDMGLLAPRRAGMVTPSPPRHNVGMDSTPVHLAFEGGLLLLSGATPELLASLPFVRFDQRANGYRAEGQ